ncbi:translocation/assembly module TamB domain-containing protein [Portibacter marinus]|uniref:translocation/assembly module TamB domain-containing protein n=1 Tax=Portibacter marinus TaxID=2898660 RepID=UPI001F40223A|nr:translocation/assembly module TamB domain-containing protein [Portibacter marinus]
MKEEPKGQGKSKSTWWSRLLMYALSLLLFLLFTIALILYVPAVQNFMVDKLASRISQSINGDVKVGKVKLNVFKGLVMEDFVISNEFSGDTVLYATSLNAGLDDNLLSLFSRKANINQIELRGLSFSDVRGNAPTYYKLADLFQKKDVVQQTGVAGNPPPFNLNVDDVILHDFTYTYIDSIKGEQRYLLLNKAVISIDSINLQKQDFYISDLDADGMKFDLTFFEKIPSEERIEEIRVQDSIYSIPDTFDLYVENLKIINGEFAQRDLTRQLHGVAKEFDPARILADNISIEATNFYTNSMAEISTKIEKGSLVSQDEQIHINDFICEEFSLSSRKMIFEGLKIETDNSVIRDNLIFKFRNIKDFNDFNNRVIMEGNIANSKVGIGELLYFAPAMKKSEFFTRNLKRQISLNGQVVGRVNSLSTPDITINVGEELSVKGRMISRNLADVDDALLNLDLKEFSMTVATLSELIPGFTPPPNFYKLGRLKFDGRFDGYFQDFVAYGGLSSDLGYADLDMRLDLKEGSENAQYSGAVELREFDLAQWSGNDQFGILEMEAEVADGKGLRLESVYAELQANVNQLEYRDYIYRDFSMEGKFEQNLFDGDFLISDPNIDLDFSGTIDFTDSIPVYNFIADVNALKLKKLNILEDDFALEGNLNINANGTDINNAQGIASGTSFIFYKDGNEFRLDSFDLTAKGAYPERRNFKLESSLADIELNGTFKLEELPDAFLSSLKTNYPNFTQQITHFRYPEPSPGYDFDIDLTIRESEDIFEVLLGESIFIRDATVLGRISDETNRSALDISFPFLEVNGNVFGGIVGDLFAQSDVGTLNLVVEYANISNVEFSPVKVEAIAREEQMQFTVSSAELLDSFTDIYVNGILKTEGDLFKVRFENTSFEAFGSSWKFNQDNNILFGTDYISIDDLVLSDGQRALSFDDINEKGVAVNIKSLNTAFFNRLTNARLRGNIDGAIEVEDVFKFRGINASINIPSFGFEDHEFGRVNLEARTNHLDEPVSYELVAYDKNKNLRLDGNYDIGLKENSGDLRINNYPLDLLEYIITDGLSETNGQFNASAKYHGKLAYPELNGEAEIVNGKAKVDYLGTRYKIGENKVKFTDGFIDFTDGVLIDSRNQKATVRGGMRHSAFRDFSLDLTISSEQFIALNTTKDDNPSYYGFAQGAIIVNFTGPFEAIVIDVTATTGRDTELNLPVEYTAEEYTTDFIEIIDYNKEERRIDRGEINLDGLSLDMKVNVTEDARVVILFDETAKDILESEGRGAIRLTINQEGQFEMNGNYEVVSGQYLFTIPSLLVNKSFNIQDGGSIEWRGDPLDANLNIEATYRDIQAPLTIFLEEYIPQSPDGLGSNRIADLAKQRTDVSLTMDLGGTMSQPDIDFDISFPNLVGELKPLTEGKLRTLELNQDAYNDQVFGLILLRTFLPTNSNQVGNNILNSNNLIGTGYSTISEFVSNQFSILLSSLFDEALQGNGYLTGVDVNLSANKNPIGIAQSTNFLLPDEYDINFVSSFDEDKWNIQLGGSYVVNSVFDVGTYFAPDFVVEYYITEDRRLKLNLYARSDYDASRTRKIQSGIGIAYRKEFNDLFAFAKAIKQEAQVNTEGK